MINRLETARAKEEAKQESIVRGLDCLGSSSITLTTILQHVVISHLSPRKDVKSVSSNKGVQAGPIILYVDI